jgi:hypothetical protein
MLFRKTLFALALAGIVIPPAFANSDIGVGIQTSSNIIPKSRADVQKELEAFRKNPFTADGTKIVNTEIGFISPRHSYGFQGGKLAHTDNIDYTTPKPSVVMTDNDRRLYPELYSR